MVENFNQKFKVALRKKPVIAYIKNRAISTRRLVVMLRMSVKHEEYLLIGDNIKIVFLGGGGGQTRIMIDAPKDVNVVRSSALEKRITDPDELAKMPKYYREVEHPEKYKKKSKVVIVNNKGK